MVGVGENVGDGVFVGVEVIVEVALTLGSGIMDGRSVAGISFSPLQAVRIMQTTTEINNELFMSLFCKEPANGLRYLRVGGRG
jgi:hypothetical protein